MNETINLHPVLATKPHYPAYDQVESAIVPERVARLMNGYL